VVRRSAVSSSSRDLGKAPAENEFGTFLPENMTAGGNYFKDFTVYQLTKFYTCLNSTGKKFHVMPKASLNAPRQTFIC